MHGEGGFVVDSKRWLPDACVFVSGVTVSASLSLLLSFVGGAVTVGYVVAGALFFVAAMFWFAVAYHADRVLTAWPEAHGSDPLTVRDLWRRLGVVGQSVVTIATLATLLAVGGLVVGLVSGG